MKNLEFQELSMVELEEVNGGGFLLACGIIAVIGLVASSCAAQKSVVKSHQYESDSIR